MDIALDPKSKKRFSVVPSGYEYLEADQRPTFHFKRLSYADFLEIQEAHDDLSAGQPTPYTLNKLLEEISSHLIGWDNVTDSDENPVDYDPAKLVNVIDIHEMLELAGVLISGGVNHKALKNSALPPQSTTAASVPSAEGDSAQSPAQS